MEHDNDQKFKDIYAETAARAVNMTQHEIVTRIQELELEILELRARQAGFRSAAEFVAVMRHKS